MSKAIELADKLMMMEKSGLWYTSQDAAAELRRLAAVEQENANLLAANKYTSDLLNQALKELAELKAAMAKEAT